MIQNHAETSVPKTLQHNAKPCPTIASVVNSGIHIFKQKQVQGPKKPRARRRRGKKEEKEEEEKEEEEEEEKKEKNKEEGE